MISHEAHMRKAIEIAKESAKNGGIPLGAILVDDTTNEVIALGESSVRIHSDPTAHAELNCIRAACKKLHTLQLAHYTLYTTMEPCHMCLSGAAWADLPRMYFGAFGEDLPANPYELRNYSAMQSAERVQLASGEPMIVRGGILRDECIALLKGYHNWFMPK